MNLPASFSFDYVVPMDDQQFALTIEVQDHRWSWSMTSGEPSPVDIDSIKPSLMEVAPDTWLIGRPDFDPAQTAILVVNLADDKVYFSGKDREGNHKFAEGWIAARRGI